MSHGHHSDEDFDHDDDDIGSIGEKGVIFEGGIRPDDIGKPSVFGGHSLDGGLAGANLDLPVAGMGHPGT